MSAGDGDRERALEQAFSSSHWVLKGIVGRGAFSTVWRAQLVAEGGATAAVKIIDLDNVLSSFEDILLEVQTMRLSKDENILRLHCSFVNDNHLWMVTQLMDMGSCLRVMNIAKAQGFGEGMNEEWLAYILRESLQGLAYLHKNGQIHRDMKAGNILLDSKGGVRLADFGVSGWTFAGGQRQAKVTTFVGTPCYMAPEVMEQAGGYDNRADIWSLGITALELAKGRAPYAHLSPMRVLVVTIEEDPPSLKSYPAPGNECQRTGAPFSAAFDDFYKKSLQKDPKLRPSAAELLKHKFLQGRSSEALVNQLLVRTGMVGQAEQEERILSSSEKLPGEGSILLEKVDDDSDSLDSSFGLGMAGDTASETGAAVCGAVSTPTADGATGSSSNYVAGTTWVFDSDDVGSSGELRRRSVGGAGGGTSPRPSSVRFSSLTGGPRKGGASLSSNSTSSPAASSTGGLKSKSSNGNGGNSSSKATVVSPSLDDFLSDFEREASTLPSLPAKPETAPVPPQQAPVPVPVPVPVPDHVPVGSSAADDDFEAFIDDIAKDLGFSENP